jgi:oxygen-dependent protoporphyrinogen oxidase
VAITLVEGSDRLGGCIYTERPEGYIVEGGPDCFLAEKPWARELCAELGIEDRLIGTDPASRRVYVLSQGRLHPLPEGFILLVPTAIKPFLASGLFSWPGKLRMAMELFVRSQRGAEDENLGSFVRRRLGQEALDKIAEPLVAGIHAGDPDTMSLRATFPRLLDMEQDYGSLIRGMMVRKREMHARHGALHASGQPASLFLALADGLGELIERLEAALKDVEIRLGTRVESIGPGQERGWRVSLVGAGLIEADAVALAVPSWQASPLLVDTDQHLAELLETIPWVSSATVTSAWDKADVGRPLDGSGFVVPRGEGRSITACTWSSIKFAGRAPAGKVLLRAFVGGAKQQALTENPDEVIAEMVSSDLADIMGLKGEPVFMRIHRWPRAMPQYTMGHLERVEAIEAACERYKGLALTGSSYRGLGIPDCINQGRQAAERTFKALPEGS